MGMAQWITFVSDRRRSADLKRCAITTMLDRRRRAGFTSWVACVDARRAAYQKLRRGASAFMYGFMRRFLNLYCQMASDNVRQVELMSRAMSKLSHRLASAGLESLKESCGERRRSQRSMSLAAAEWQRKGPRKPWGKWQSSALSRRALTQALSSLKLRRLRQGFNSWLFLRADESQVHGLRRRGLMALMSSQLRRGANAWSLFSGSRKAVLHKMHSTIASLRSRASRRGLNSWSEYAAGHRRTHRMLELSLTSLANRSLSAGFRSLEEARVQRHSEHRSMLCAARHWAPNAILRRWLVWKLGALAHGACERAQRQARARTRANALLRALRATRDDARTRSRRGEYVLRAMRTRVVRRARQRLHSWQLYAKARTASFVCLLRAVNAYRARLLERGLRGWRGCVARLHYRLRVFARGIAGEKQGKLRAVLAKTGRWRLFAAQKLRSRSVSRAAFAHLHHHMQRFSFTLWATAFRSQRRVQALVDLKRKVERGRLSVVYFHGWAQKRASTPGIHPKEVQTAFASLRHQSPSRVAFLAACAGPPPRTCVYLTL